MIQPLVAVFYGQLEQRDLIRRASSERATGRCFEARIRVLKKAKRGWIIVERTWICQPPWVLQLMHLDPWVQLMCYGPVQ